ncbi:MAG: PH domain-containing protein [Oscillospiraceae bacterium]|nr:PH domain-containing protein [Oscillospiraceae bacterium]
MSKYDTIANIQPIDIRNVLVEGEKVLWSGKPKKSAFVINKSLMMLPFALLWLAVDGGFIFIIVSSGAFSEMAFFIVPFFALHLFPVWKWLSNVLTANKRWENTQYAVTDKRIIIQSGFIGMDYISLYYKDITNVRLNIGAIDKLLQVGDIYFDTKTGSGMLPIQTNTNKVENKHVFLDIENAYELYPKLQKIVLDIQTDIQYPNDLRPETNEGYRTEYRGKF